MEITILNNQTLADISIRYCGTINALADISILNNISITKDLMPGQTLLIPKKDYGFEEVINFFKSNKINPATSLTEEQIALTEGNAGIGFWAIGNNFIVV